MISYPRKAIAALAYLFRPYNDIDVYVEDTTCRNLYQILLDRMLNGQAKVSRVFQLGGRTEVLKACTQDQGGESRPRLYIIDGDFDALLGNDVSDMSHLYQLRAYCSENLVITSNAIREVTVECLPNVSREEIESIIQFSEFLDDVVGKLVPLLVMYGVAHLLDTGIETTGFNVMRLTVQKSGAPHLSEDKVQQRITEVRTALQQQYSKEEIDSAIEVVEERLPKTTVECAKLIPGKTCLLPLVFHCLRHRGKFKGTSDQFRVRLARHCELNVDPGLLDAVRQASRN